MTDLHTHILPGMDDGARDRSEALKLVGMENKSGVTQIMCTPHFHPEKETVESFVTRRERAAQALSVQLHTALPEMQLHLGAEVRLTPLHTAQLRPLCFQNTNVLLVEMPWMTRPVWDVPTLKQLRSSGMLPLIAHVERYSYIQQNPEILLEWAQTGALMQVNASSLTDEPHSRELVLRLIRHRLAHVVASDTHSPDRRPPKLSQAMSVIASQLGEFEALRLRTNADLLYQGKSPKIEPPVPFQKQRKLWRFRF